MTIDSMFTAVIPLHQCRPNGGTFVRVGDHELAVFHLTDSNRVYVIDNTCPHAGGNLAGGEVAGRIVTCPWHHWEFDLATGACVHSARARVRLYPAEVRDGVVWADLGKDECGRANGG